jgi:hypothetical protein
MAYPRSRRPNYARRLNNFNWIKETRNNMDYSRRIYEPMAL